MPTVIARAPITLPHADSAEMRWVLASRESLMQAANKSEDLEGTS